LKRLGLQRLELVAEYDPAFEAVAPRVVEMPPREAATEPEAAQRTPAEPIVESAVELEIVAELAAGLDVPTVRALVEGIQIFFDIDEVGWTTNPRPIVFATRHTESLVATYRGFSR
jgi:hypothetical protein